MKFFFYKNIRKFTVIENEKFFSTKCNRFPFFSSHAKEHIMLAQMSQNRTRNLND